MFAMPGGTAEVGGWECLSYTIASDYANFYNGNTLGRLAIGLGLGAVLAHTNGDTEIRNWYQDSVRHDATDDIAHIVEPLGNGRYTVPVCSAALLLGTLIGKTSIGSLSKAWGSRSLRTMLVGIPPLLLLQHATGASRPTEADSAWRPFEDDNGVSGHSFMGAVPLLSAAMMAENFFFKTLWYAGSTLCGMSRINDDKHYFSQAMLGWWLAYLAARSIDRTEDQATYVSVSPVFWQHGQGVGLGITITF